MQIRSMKLAVGNILYGVGDTKPSAVEIHLLGSFGYPLF